MQEAEWAAAAAEAVVRARVAEGRAAAATEAAERVGAAREEAKVAATVVADLVGARAAGKATEAEARRSAPRPPAAAQP